MTIKQFLELYSKHTSDIHPTLIGDYIRINEDCPLTYVCKKELDIEYNSLFAYRAGSNLKLSNKDILKIIYAADNLLQTNEIQELRKKLFNV